MTTTQEELRRRVLRIRIVADQMLSDFGTKKAFLSQVDRVEEACRELKELVVMHSRKLKKGVRLDGKPDRRFKKWRQASQM